MAYIKGEGKPTGAPEDRQGCPFCEVPQLDDETGLIVTRGKSMYVVLNKFPYNSGHLMICPFRHVADYTDLHDEEVAEMGALVQRSMRVIRAVMGAHGFNIGMNQGAISGAGIAGHLHQHIVPRWGGDANFMPIVGQTKVIPQFLSDTRAQLAQSWEKELS
ncbi:HIT family protein [Natronoglycomyces albus]|uniref:HIT domain-containing protein n=1 Tax=Natronoglycomyces albus TaxID=2811108 RepID=A0A895XU72_9ACTN|nr:HIT domain-containing protein [Natronoglycomyces albus]